MTFRLRIIIAVVVLIASVAAFGWQKDQPKFTSSSQIVLVPVVVTLDNKPIGDLKASDFELLEDGKPQKIASFEPPRPDQPARPPSITASDYSNMDSMPQRRLVIIALDAQNISPGSKPFATDAITRFLNQGIQTGDRIAVIVLTGGGFKILHDFTGDAASLRHAIDKIRMGTNLAALEPLNWTSAANQTGGTGDPESIAVQEALTAMQQTTQQAQLDLTENLTADSFRAIAKTYGPLPGRKTLVWVTDGFPRRKDKPVLSSKTTSADAGIGTNTAQFDTVFRALNDANIAIYPVDTRGLVVLIPDAGGGGRADQARAMAEAAAENIDTMMWFATETGGKAFYNGNDIPKALDRAVSETDSAYMLSYALPPDAKKGWHNITVKVNRPGARVNTRKGFFAGSGGAQTPEQELAAVVHSPFAYNALPVMVRWTGQQAGSGGKKNVIFQFAVPPDAFASYVNGANRFELEVRALATNSQGQAAADFGKKFGNPNLTPENAAKLAKGGFSYTGQLEVPSGDYNVTFAIRDNVTGRVGSVQAALKVN